MGEVLVGCCGWPEARPRYFEHFSLVELQDTFYQLPSLELAARWRNQAPAGFHFTMKAWQLITHPASSPTYRRLKKPLPEKERAFYGGFQPNEQVWAAWQQTAAIARTLRAEVIVFQCPASFRPEPKNIRNLEAFFCRAERQGWQMAWEPRGDWPAEIVRRICREYDLVHCVDPFQAEPLHGSLIYFRLHGRGGYRYQYTDEELRELAGKVARAANEGLSAYVLFNNVFMKEDALRFSRLWTSPTA